MKSRCAAKSQVLRAAGVCVSHAELTYETLVLHAVQCMVHCCPLSTPVWLTSLPAALRPAPPPPGGGAQQPPRAAARVGLRGACHQLHAYHPQQRRSAAGLPQGGWLLHGQGGQGPEPLATSTCPAHHAVWKIIATQLQAAADLPQKRGIAAGAEMPRCPAACHRRKRPASGAPACLCRTTSSLTQPPCPAPPPAGVPPAVHEAAAGAAGQLHLAAGHVH